MEGARYKVVVGTPGTSFGSGAIVTMMHYVPGTIDQAIYQEAITKDWKLMPSYRVARLDRFEEARADGVGGDNYITYQFLDWADVVSFVREARRKGYRKGLPKGPWKTKAILKSVGFDPETGAVNIGRDGDVTYTLVGRNKSYTYMRGGLPTCEIGVCY